MSGAAEPVEVSIVVPLYNEAANIEELHARVTAVLGARARAFEIIYVDDGSADATADMLRRLHAADVHVHALILNRNYGQHAAVAAGFDYARGDVVVTLDGDLQNPPEEIPKLLDKIEQGHDVVGGWRRERHDSAARLCFSRIVNRVTSRIVGVEMNDYGCMLRAYRRSVVERIRASAEGSTFIPALANAFAASAAEVPIAHAPRRFGRSRYSPLRLLRLNFDLLTGFSLLPIQMVSVAGILVAFFGLAFALFLLVRRLVVGPEVEGVFTLFAVLFFFVGIQILALGLIGEYIGRIYLEVRRRPRYIVKENLE
jgi:undecaprenyl-phosphate 4-deoxy-4-formamido-L-arabinose transferase